MNFKTVTSVFLFVFLSVIAFGQVKDKVNSTILFTKNNNQGLEFIRGGCGNADDDFSNKKKMDSLQNKLDNLNATCLDKDYMYVMCVYSDYSFELKKNYGNVRFNTISGEEYRRFPND